MKKYFTTALSLSVVVAAGLFAVPVNAQPLQYVAVCESSSSIFGFSPWYACLPGGNTGEPRIEELNDVFLIIFPVLEGLVKAAAYIAAAMIFVSIIKFIIARGNASKAATAMGGVRDAVIGFIIALIAVAIVNFIASAFTV